MNFQSTIPFDFWVASWLMSKDVPGSWSLYRQLIMSKYARHAFSYPLQDEGRIWVPAGWPQLFVPEIFEQYEENAIAEFSNAIAIMDEPVIVVDCGADVGAFSRLVLLRTNNVEKIYAIEPNQSSFPILKRNLDFIPKPTVCYPGGAAKESGRGSLVPPDPDAHPHAFFIDPNDEDGEIPLIALDELITERDRPIAMKVDVEGLELDVLHGAEDLLRSVPTFVVQFEAHPEVTERCGVDPMECIHFLNEIRPCKFTGCNDVLQNKMDIEPSGKVFFGQADPTYIYNVVAVPIE